MNSAIDITSEQRKMLVDLVRQYIPGVAVWAYGSRVKWTARPNSDLDLVVFTAPDQIQLVSELKNDLAESELPFLVDLHVWDEIPERFRQIIRGEYVVIQEEMDEPISLFDLRIDGWDYTTLGEICAKGQGGVQTGPFGSQLHASDYVAEGIPSIMPQNIGDNRIIRDGIARITTEDAERLERYRVRTGDIVYSRRGDVERRALVRSEEDGWLCGTGCLRVRFGSSDVDSAFASFYLGDPRVRSWIVRHAQGATMPNLNTAILSALPFVVPPIEEQRAIAQILSALDDKIELNRKLNETLEATARAVFKSWFVDFDPVRAKAEGREPDGMDADTVALFPSEFVESSLGSLPISYFISDLQSECAISMGQSPPGSTYNECVEGLPFFQGRADFKTMFPKRRIYCSEPSRFASAGDVLLSVRAPVGDINIALDDCAIGRGVASIRHKSGSTAYSWCLLKSLKASFDSFDTEGTVFGAINGKDLKALKTVVPPAAIVESFASLFDPVFSKLKLNELEARTLADLRDTLLPRLISGKLRVPEVEAMLTGGCREV